MPQKYTLRTCKFLFSLASAVGLALCPSGRAQICRSHCEPSSAVYHSPFFGYYRTCWRPWPGGQPPCPCYPSVQPTEQPLPPGTGEPGVELLPPPRLEEPESK